MRRVLIGGTLPGRWGVFLRRAGERVRVEDAAKAAADRRDGALRKSPEERRRRGVVHTPVPLARAAVRLVDATLRVHLDRPGGIGDPHVAVLDPACGPGGFLASVHACAASSGRPHGVCGIDLDPAAVADAESILRPAFARADWPLTLRAGDALANLQPFEAALPDDVIPVVLGNPPWAGRSANRGAATAALLEDFRRDEAGRRLPERKLGVLSDDYVRFFRWSAEIARSARAGGVVALVTNASFLDGPVHRGMRGALVRWFHGVEVVDLGGGSLVARDGIVDENVFRVRPSVALTLLWRRGAADRPAAVRGRYRRLRGARVEKLRRLERLDQLPTETLNLGAPGHAFRPMGDVPARYWTWPALDEVMPFHREGVQTNRDAAVTDPDRASLLRRLNAFASGDDDPCLSAALTHSPHYDPEKARNAVRNALEAAGVGAVAPLAYRPGEQRWFAPIRRFCHRPRPELLRAVARSSVVLVTVRKDRGERPWTHAAATEIVPDNCFLSNRSSCRARAFPNRGPDGADNLSSEAKDRLGRVLGHRPEARKWIDYALAFLVSAAYRRVFDPALRRGYPRVPWPTSRARFLAIGKAGAAVRSAFLGPTLLRCSPGRGAGGVPVGHFTVRSRVLAAAIEAAEAAVGQEIAATR